MYAKLTDRVGIVGIGGLGHMGVKFAAAYGCDVTAFTSSESKFDKARGLAYITSSSRDSNAINQLAGSLDLLIVTVNVTLDWPKPSTPSPMAGCTSSQCSSRCRSRRSR